jgi:threonine/homoserine/homoserine lactone efflux protein
LGPGRRPGQDGPLYLATLAAATGWAVRWLRQTRVRRAMEGTTGLCMVGLGASIALDHSL